MIKKVSEIKLSDVFDFGDISRGGRGICRLYKVDNSDNENVDITFVMLQTGELFSNIYKSNENVVVL